MKISKRIISGLLIVTMCILSTISASAIENNYFQQTQISYTYEGNYMIYIPMEVNVGENISIMADEINILNNKKIIVAIGNLDCDNRIVLSNENNEDKVYVILKDTDGHQITTNNTIIGEFANDSYSYKNINTEICYDSMVKAGTYTGYVDFYIEVADK